MYAKLVSVVRLSALLHDARPGRGCDPSCSPRLAHFLSLTPDRLDCGGHQGRRQEAELSREVLRSIAADMEASHRALPPRSIQPQEKIISAAGRCRIRGQLLLRGQLPGPDSKQELLLKRSIRLVSETVFSARMK